MSAQEACGSKPCTDVVDKLGNVMTRQQADGIQAIKELMKVHHDAIKDDVADVKLAIKEQGDEIFPRLRTLENRIEVLAATGLTEKKVRDIVAADSGVTWARGQKRLSTAVLILLATAAIIATYNAVAPLVFK
jgi:signal transduction histidine kinase